MRKIAMVAIAALLCFAFLGNAPAQAQTATVSPRSTTSSGSSVIYVLVDTTNPTFEESDITKYPWVGNFRDFPIPQRELYDCIQQNIIPNDDIMILELGTPYFDADYRLAEMFYKRMTKNQRTMLITHYDERFVTEDYRYYFDFINDYLNLDIFYYFTTEIIVPEIEGGNIIYSENYFLNPNNEEASPFNGSLILDRFFLEYAPAEFLCDYYNTYNSHYNITNQIVNPDDRLLNRMFCEEYRNSYLTLYDDDLAYCDLWNRNYPYNQYKLPYIFVRTVDPMNYDLKYETEFALQKEVPYIDIQLDLTPGENGYLPIPENYHAMKEEYLDAFMIGEDIPHEPK